MKIGVIQFKAGSDPDENLKRASELIRKTKDVDLIILPESFIFPFGTEFKKNTDYLIDHFSKLAKEVNTFLVAGSIPEISSDDTYNTSFVFNPAGEIIGKHRKVYLYDVDLPNLKTNESDRFSKGNSATVFETPFGKFGLLICYDLRFDHLFIECAKNGAHTILLPASFSAVTGPKHWKTLLKARALDSQCFVLGCGAAENKEAQFKPYGHSLLASPDGQVLTEAGEDEEIIIMEYDPNEVNFIRESLPVLKQL